MARNLRDERGVQLKCPGVDKRVWFVAREDMPRRGTCTVCGRDVALTRDGFPYWHGQKAANAS